MQILLWTSNRPGHYAKLKGPMNQVIAFLLQVAVIVDGVTKKAAEIATVKDDAERDLAAAKPALDAALSALNSITQKDIVGLKALKNPPDIVKRIFDAVLLLRYCSKLICQHDLRFCSSRIQDLQLPRTVLLFNWIFF